MDSEDVDDMFSSLGNTLGWFQYEDIDSAIKGVNNNSKLTPKKKPKEKKTKKGNTKNSTPPKKKQSTTSSVEKSDYTSLLAGNLSALSYTAGTNATDLNEVERKHEKINFLIKNKLDVGKKPSHQKNISPEKYKLSSSLEMQFKENNSFDVNNTEVGYRLSSTDFSDDSVTSSSSNFCKKILFNSDDSSLLNSKLENSAKSNSSSFNESFKEKSSPEKGDCVIVMSDDQNDNCKNSDQFNRSNKLETDTKKRKENEFIDVSSSSDDDDDDVDSLIQKLLTPLKISVGDSTNKLSNLSKIEEEKNFDSRSDPSSDNSFKQKLVTCHKNNDKNDGKRNVCSSVKDIPQQSQTWILRDRNTIDNLNSQSESCNSSSDDDDFEVFLEKMKNPVKEIRQWLPKSMKEFIVSSSDESSEEGNECLLSYHHTNKILIPEIDKLPLFGTPARRYTQKSDPDERGSLNDNKDKIGLSFCTPKQSTEMFNKPSINFPQTEIKRDPAVKPSLSRFCEVTPKGIGTSKNLKKHIWTPDLKSSESQQKLRTNQPAEDYASFLKSLSIGAISNSIDPRTQKYIKHFRQNQVELVSKLFKMYNETVFEGHFPVDFSIRWNKRLLTTAGHCILRSKYTNNRDKCQRQAEICLATKICDTPERVRDTLLHEMCHAAVWLVNGSREGHGRLWKSWAHKANLIFPYLPLVKRCHSYDIATKYTYRCVNCGYSFGRHSKSLDTTKKVCGYCQGQFELLLSNNTPTSTPARTPNKFALFVKEHYGMVKKFEKCSHKEVMKILGEKFRQVQI